VTTSDSRRGILDTNTMILLPQLDDPNAPSIRASEPTITLAELSLGPLLASSNTERANRQAHLQQAEADFDALPFDQAAARSLVRSLPTYARQAERHPHGPTTPSSQRPRSPTDFPSTQLTLMTSA